ncbi:MAG: hypothetical protein V4719_15955 [Planctomycetota bacterium]
MDLNYCVQPHRAVLALLIIAVGLLGSLLVAERGPGNRVSDRTKALNVTEPHFTDVIGATELLGNSDLHKRVAVLVAELYRDENKVAGWGTIVPGGEHIQFTQPMIDLIRLGENARLAVESRIHDERICKEAALILGAIGKKETIPILIDAYPKQVYWEDRSRDGDEEYYSLRKKHVCFTYSLTYLTGQPIGRDRGGTIFEDTSRAAWQKSASREAWQGWWESCKNTFVLPVPKPTGTWVPSYNYSMRECN